MTAEIAVLNRTAAALAADSASTSLQATGLPKIFNTADKLFHLDGVSPIGVMIYGNASFMGVPWETIIKQYRAAKPSPCAQLKDAAAQFLNFLASPGLFSDAHIESWLRIHLAEVVAEIWRHTESQISAGANRAALIADLATRINSWPLLPSISNAAIDAFELTWGKHIDAVLDTRFTNPALEKQERDRMHRVLAILNLSVPQQDDGVTSGVVLAGFGEDELFPALWNCQVRSVLAQRMLQKTPEQAEELVMPMTAMIRPFAQAEMAYSFMNGMDPNLRQAFEATISALLQKFGEDMAQTSGLTGQQLVAFRASAKVTEQLLGQQLSNELNRYSREKHIEPVLGAIGLLPKDQLAVMAETLVSLTSFKRKMSRDAETVGGDVDVAVISKGDGFVWVKRKHYFPLELNPRYAERIRRGK